MKLKPSDGYWIFAAVAGVITWAALRFWIGWAHPWWGPALCGFLAAAGLYGTLMKVASEATIIDGLRRKP